MSEQLETAKKVARRAGEILLKYYKGEYDVDGKAEDRFDPVTTADHEAEECITNRLEEEFPEDKILSEEDEEHSVDDFSGRVWIVDPMDGTVPFTKHLDGFCVLIGVCVDGTPELGVAYLPAKDELLYAEKGKGAFLEKEGKKEKLSVSDTSVLSEAIAPSNKPWDDREVMTKSAEKTGFDIVEKGAGGYGIKALFVSEGKVDLHISRGTYTAKWDTCAPQVILEEAGGKLTDGEGNPLDYNKEGDYWKHLLVASNGKIHDELISVIRSL